MGVADPLAIKESVRRRNGFAIDVFFHLAMRKEIAPMARCGLFADDLFSR
jgi:hypothetical protein